MKKQRVAVNGEVLTTAATGSLCFDSSWGEGGNDDGQLQFPYDIAVGMDGNVYVSDMGNNRIQCFNSTGVFLRKWGRNGSGNGEFDRPCQLAIGICDGMNQFIRNAMMAISELRAFPPGVLPICVAYIGEECIAVTEDCNHRIQIFDTNGIFIRKWGTKGRENGQFNTPTGCCFDRSGEILYVSDTCNHRIQAFGLDGTFIRKWGNRGNDDGQFYVFGSISMSKNGFIYVCDLGNPRICCFTPDGGFIRHIIIPGSIPSSVVVNELDDSLYICDGKNHCIRHHRVHGTFIDAFGSYGRGDGQFYAPRSIVSTNSGLFYVADNHRVVRLRHQTF